MKVLAFINSVSTTALRIIVTMMVFLLTTISYLFAGKSIDISWLTFLATMSGVDAVQFVQKRKTHIPDETPPDTDIQELSKEKDMPG